MRAPLRSSKVGEQSDDPATGSQIAASGFSTIYNWTQTCPRSFRRRDRRETLGLFVSDVMKANHKGEREAEQSSSPDHFFYLRESSSQTSEGSQEIKQWNFSASLKKRFAAEETEKWRSDVPGGSVLIKAGYSKTWFLCLLDVKYKYHIFIKVNSLNGQCRYNQRSV